MGKYILGLDNGNSVCKATLFDLRGKEIQVIRNKVNRYYPKPGHSERDMDELWETMANTIRQVMYKSGIKAREIIVVGSTGHGNGLYLLDKSGEPLRGIQSLDSRAHLINEIWNQDQLQEQTYPRTFQKFWPAQSNSLLVWLKCHEIHTYEKIGSVLLCKDYINYCLTGEIVSDYSDISATNLLNISERCYDPVLLKLYDLEDISHALPRLVNSSEIIGNITGSAAEKTGLLVNTPVAGGMLDVNASMIGSGITKAGQAAIIAGTWSVNSVVTKQPLKDKDLAMTALFAIPNNYVTIEASATSVTNLEWFINQFCEAERIEAKRRGVSVYSICDEIVSSRSWGNSPVIFHPFLHGSNTQANARAGFFGLAGWHKRADALKAVYEGLVFSHLYHIEKLKRAGADFNVARFTGGGAQSPVLGQLFADILNTTIEVPENRETGALGTAIAAGVGIGVYHNYDEAVQETVKIKKVYHPNSCLYNEYNSRYKEFKNLQSELDESWNRLKML